MLFEPIPKEKREDLFNFDKEVEKIIAGLKDPLTRMIVLKGLRRTGKSSILRVALNEAKLNYILIDMREFEDLDRMGFSLQLSKVLSSVIRGRKRVVLDRIRAVSFVGMKIEFERREIDTFMYKFLLRRINDWARRKRTYFVIAIDEAQEIAKINFDKYLAFVYDNLRYIKIILTGSQVGVLSKILDNPEKPLFGRARIDIDTRYLTREEAIGFLTLGFKEAGVEIDNRTIEYIVNHLNGVAGWLTLFGWYVIKGKTVEEALNRTLELGMKTAIGEFQNFLETRGIGKKRYIEVMKILAEGQRRWKEIKTLLEVRLGRNIPNNQISKYLNELRKYGFIVKRNNIYMIPDPLLRRGIINKY